MSLIFTHIEQSQSLREAFNDTAFQNTENCCGLSFQCFHCLLNPHSKGLEDPNWRKWKEQEHGRMEIRQQKQEGEEQKVGQSKNVEAWQVWLVCAETAGKNRISGKKSTGPKMLQAIGDRDRGNRDLLGHNLHVIPKSHTLCSCFCQTTRVKLRNWVETK